MKNFLSIICSLLLFSLVSTSFAEEQIREVTATGPTQKEAVANALLEAVQQVKGTKLKGSEELRSKLIEASSLVNGESNDVQAMNSSQQSTISKSTEGIIKSYSILNVDKSTEGLGWEATLEVIIPVYKTPGISPHSLRKIAVIPFHSKLSSVKVFGKTIASKEISRQLNQKMVTELTQSRRFSVLDREYMGAFLQEKKLVLSKNSPLEEQAKVGEALGVDYLLLGTITDFSGKQTKTYIKALDETSYTSQAYLNIDFRIMVMATRQIKWSDTVKVKSNNQQLKSIYKEQGAQGVADYLLETAAQKIVHSSLNNIYPIKVLKAASKKAIYLNQGGKMTSLDQVYDVYTPGEKITDPDSGLNIKIDGEKVASIKITKVLAKYSLAKLVKGQLQNIQAGAIVRIADNETKKSRKKKQQRVMEPNW